MLRAGDVKMKRFRIGKYAFILFMVLTLLLVPAGVWAETEIDTAAEEETDLAMIEAFDLISNYHVSGISSERLAEIAIKAMVESLNDPFTTYMSSEEWQNFEDSMELRYVGVGMRVGIDDQGFYALEVFEGSPAAQAGIQRGDYIVEVEGKSTQGLSFDQLVEGIIGEQDTAVKITVKRNGNKMNMPIVRQPVQVPVIYSKWMGQGVGYLELSSFSSQADKQFVKHLEKLTQNDMSSLVIDLRGNTGGLLDTTVNIAKNFIKEGVLMHTKDRDRIDDPVMVKNGITAPYGVVLLVDEHSASASEVLSGALRDYGVATLVGAKTYGKGSVQTSYALSNGGVLKLTVQEYFTPYMHRVHNVGLEPDIKVIGEAAQLITALYTAGLRDMDITAKKSETIINGMPFLDQIDVLRENGKVYMPSRVLAALIGGKIGWNPQSRSVVIEKNGAVTSFAVNGQSTVMKEAASYIELGAFKSVYPVFDFSTLNDQVMLKVKKE
jgi:carboxyl-terminal processing protease